MIFKEFEDDVGLRVSFDLTEVEGYKEAHNNKVTVYMFSGTVHVIRSKYESFKEIMRMIEEDELDSLEEFEPW